MQGRIQPFVSFPVAFQHSGWEAITSSQIRAMAQIYAWHRQ